MKYFLFSCLFFFKEVLVVSSSSSIPHPTANAWTFVKDSGAGLDNRRCGSSYTSTRTWLNATLLIGNVDFSNARNASLVVPAHDVDIPMEKDYVYFNGRHVGNFTGKHDQWNLNTFPLRLTDIKNNEDNDISVHVDIDKMGWCVSVDWVAVVIDYTESFPEHEDMLIEVDNRCSNLKIKLSFNNLFSTQCDVQGSLVDSNGNFIEAITSRVPVDSVNNMGSIDYLFPGDLLGGNNLEGPFSLTGVLVTCDNGSQYLKPMAHTTAAYTLYDMKCPGSTDAPTPSLTDAPTPSPTDAPTPSPTHAPTPSPTHAPTPSPTHAPATDEYEGAGVKGDPHFQTWSGEQYDFHGVCDLVLLSNPKFGNGVGLDVHIRTKKTRSWSYVDSGSVRIGKDVLEVTGGGGTKFWINGIQGDENTDELSVSEYSIKYQQINEKSEKFVVDLGEGEGIVLKTWNSFVSIKVENPTSKNFVGSVGLMGSFPQGLKIGRENSILEDFDAFGQEWQVLSTEENLFHDIEGPQHPLSCEIPTSTEMRRRLKASSITIQDAEKWCSHAGAEDKELCIFDVMATNDQSSAGAY